MNENPVRLTAMRRAAKVDANHNEVVDAFRALGCSVTSLAAVGKGCPDLLVGICGRNLLVEVKDGAKRPSARKLTPAQEDFKGEWRGSVLYVERLSDVPTIVNAFRWAAA